jgi:hypothetical protein
LTKPLYEVTKGGEQEPMVWGEEQDKAFKEIKRALTNIPALCLPDVMKPFFLHVRKRLRTAIGVLIQLLGSWHHPVAYLSKQFPELPCLGTLAATAILMAESDKLTSGQELTV